MNSDPQRTAFKRWALIGLLLFVGGCVGTALAQNARSDLIAFISGATATHVSDTVPLPVSVDGAAQATTVIDDSVTCAACPATTQLPSNAVIENHEFCIQVPLGGTRIHFGGSGVSTSSASLGAEGNYCTKLDNTDAMFCCSTSGTQAIAIVGEGA